MIKHDNAESYIREGARLLDVAEGAHIERNPEATEWYLRAIAYLLLALCKAKSP